MPTVNTPDGKVIHFPDNFTEEQILASMKELSGRAKQEDEMSDRRYMGRPTYPDKPRGLERIGKGAQDVLDRVAQLTVAGGEAIGHYPEGLGDQLTANVNKENAEYEENRGIDPGIDMARLAGNVGMTAPLALVPGGQTTLGAIGSGAATGAVSGALQFDPTNSAMGSLKNIGTGAVAGGILNPVARGIGIGIKKVLDTAGGRLKGVMEQTRGRATADEVLKAVPEMRELPKEVRASLIIEAQEQIKKTGELNVEQLGRKANLVANNVTPTKSMVTRDPRDWTMERNAQKLAQSPDEQIAGLGQELTSTYQANDLGLTKKLGEIRGGLPKGSQEAQGMTVMKSLDDLSKASQKEVGKLYEQVRVTKGDQLASDAKKLASTLDDLKDNTYSEKLVSSVQNKLKRFGMLDADGNLTAQTLTVTQAEELRKFVNTLPNDFGKKDIIRAIDEDVLSGAGDDAFGQARGAAKQRFDMLDNPTTQKALNTYGELMQGKTAQSFIRAQVIDAPEQDLKSLLTTLSKLPKDDAQKAKDAMGAGILDYLQEKAVNKNSGQFSGAGLNTAIDKIGETKLRMVLGDQGLKELKSLARAGLDATYQPPYAAVNSSNTAPFLLAMTQRARAIPGVPLILNENLEKAAARVGYGKQVKDILKAKSKAMLPDVDLKLGLIRGAVPPAANAVLDQKRKKPDEARQQQ